MDSVRRATRNLDRFWARVDKNGPVPNHRPDLARCWLWTGGLYLSGYGAYWYEGRTQRAHSVAYRLFVGPINDALWVLHTCDRKACVNPAHLYLGTVTQNAQDAVERGLYRTGEGNGRSKLTVGDVRDIRRRFSEGATVSALSRDFQVSRPAIRCVIDRVTWKHVE